MDVQPPASAPLTPPLLTVGHGPLDRHRLGDLLAAAGVELVVDVRRFPGSRNNPDVSRAALSQWLGDAGIGYRWEESLGGRRRLPADVPQLDSWWTVAAFRAYAAHTRSPDFAEALDRVLADAREATVAVMCSESVWWRCHRRLLADVAVVGRDVPVQHLMPGGRMSPHRPAEGSRLGPDGLVVWDGG